MTKSLFLFQKQLKKLSLKLKIWMSMSHMVMKTLNYHLLNQIKTLKIFSVRSKPDIPLLLKEKLYNLLSLWN